MQELREAMNDYMRQLAENAEPGDETDQPDQGERTDMSMPISKKCCARSKN